MTALAFLGVLALVVWGLIALARSTSRDSQERTAVSAYAGATRTRFDWVVSRMDGPLALIEAVSRELGGDSQESMWYRAVFGPLRVSHAKWAKFLQEDIEPVASLLSKAPGNLAEHHGQNIPWKSDQVRYPRTRGEVAMLALTTGEAGNRRRLEKLGVGSAEISAIFNVLTTEELAWIQALWDAFAPFATRITVFTEEDSGVAVEVEAVPISSRSGYCRGGYWPMAMVADPPPPLGTTLTVGDILASEYLVPWTHPSTPRLKECRLALSISDAPLHLARVAHYVAFKEAVRSVSNLLLHGSGTGKVHELIRRKLGDEVAILVVQALMDLGQMRLRSKPEHSLRQSA